MSELKRWTEEGAPQAIERLLNAAESEEPSAASVANTLTRLGIAAGVTSAAASSGAAGATALTGAATGQLSGLSLVVTFAKWIALGSTLGGLGVAVYTASSGAPAPARSVGFEQAPAAATSDGARRRASTLSAAPPPSAARTPSATPSSSVAPARSLAPRAPSMPSTSTRSGRSNPDSEGVADAIPAETLAAEIAGIDRARSLLAAGRYGAATGALDDYERRFPRQHFAPEVLYLRMQAAQAAGRADEARGLARSLLTRYPTSPQSEKAKRLLDRRIE